MFKEVQMSAYVVGMLEYETPICRFWTLITEGFPNLSER